MNGILYSQCWEDPRLLLEALRIGPGDDAVSIASGGDNSLALLLGDPRSVTAVDFNPAQIRLVELKVAAMRRFDHEDFVRFMGARPCEDRERMLMDLLPGLSVLGADFWLRRLPAIRGGVIHCGRFERYLAAFRGVVLPLIHDAAAVANLLAAPTTDDQDRIYREIWDNRRWRLLFRLFFGQTVMARFGRNREFFRFADGVDVAGTLIERVRAGLTGVPIRDNFFVRYILTGHYGDLASAPPYLHPDHFHTIKARLDHLKIVCAGLRPWLEGRREGAFSAFNLSDIFEYMAPETAAATLAQVIRVSRPGGRLAYWTLFADRPVPESLRQNLCPHRPDLRFVPDRAFFYDRLQSCAVRKGAA